MNPNGSGAQGKNEAFPNSFECPAAFLRIVEGRHSGLRLDILNVDFQVRLRIHFACQVMKKAVAAVRQEL